MRHRSRPWRSAAALAAFSLATAVWAGGASSAADRTGGAEDIEVALVATQAAGDDGPIDGLIDGLARAEEEFGVHTQFLEALDPATFETTLRNLANSGTDIIVTTFFEMSAVVAEIAPDLPDTTFIVMVGAPNDPAIPNVQVMVYEVYVGAYVGGAYAASMTESGKLGYIGGVALPFAWADFNAFTDGARSVNPDIETTAVFAESFEDPAKGRELATSMFNEGIDFIFTGAAGTDVGVVEAAVELDGMIMTASPPLVERAPGQVAIVTAIEWADSLVREVEYALSDEFTGGFRTAGVETGEITFDIPDEFLEQASGDRPERSREATALVDELIGQLESGDLVVEEIGEER